MRADVVNHAVPSIDEGAIDIFVAHFFAVPPKIVRGLRHPKSVCAESIGE